MNTDDSTATPASAGTSESRSDRPAVPGRTVALLALLLAGVGVAGSGWLWWSDYRSRAGQTEQAAEVAARTDRLMSELDARLRSVEARFEDLAGTDVGTRLATLEDRLDALAAGAREMDAHRAETAAWSRAMQASLERSQARFASIEARLDALAARGADGSAALVLAELDFLLRLAQERLQLFGDIRTADRALELADAQAAARDDPLYNSLRREVAAARRALAAVELPDPVTLDRELGGVQQRLSLLPFQGERAADTPPAQAPEGGWWMRLKAVLSSLVTVRRVADEGDRLPALADQELIRQRAWLEVERARLAVMRRDEAVYRAALENARGTIQRWFQPDDRGTRAVLQTLESALALDVDPELPDISGPWAALRALQAAGAALPPAAAEAMAPESADGPAVAAPEAAAGPDANGPAGDHEDGR